MNTDSSGTYHHTDWLPFLNGFIRTEVNRTGLSRAVIGLSRWLDSPSPAFWQRSTVQKLCAVRMPYKTSLAGIARSCATVIDATGVQSHRGITPCGPPFQTCTPNQSCAKQYHGAPADVWSLRSVRRV